ncbi:RAB GTPase homolog A6A [Striga asiatica]|uniref:RAB GTPase homolog A6A n=1 Tax=Striga asiatica TaxID=4170 RepID=A0A5A7PI06_STRAF|nr:RAB GTPase homolog A6A [Striga asiatica]
MVVVLVGNKSDLTKSREVDMEDGKCLAQLESLSFMETSTKENLNVEEAFFQMITRIFEITRKKSLLESNKMSDHDQATSASADQTVLKLEKKEIICIDELSATKQNSHCCSY